MQYDALQQELQMLRQQVEKMEIDNTQWQSAAQFWKMEYERGKEQLVCHFVVGVGAYRASTHTN
jgi:prefoldin subunit 5